MSPVVSMIRRLALLATVMICLIATGCSDGYKDVVGRRAVRVGTTSDINPRDPTTLGDGGNLRLAVSSFPANFNVLNIDGNTADVGSIVTPTLPGAFITQADGSLKLNTDYFNAAELTKGTKLVFPAAGWQHTLLKKEFTPEGMLMGHNTLYFANPNASPLAKEFVAWYAKTYNDYPEWEADRAYFALASYKAAYHMAQSKELPESLKHAPIVAAASADA